MPFIGDVHIPLTTELGGAQSREVEETPTGVAEFQRQLENGDLSFVLHEPTQKQDYTLSEQRAAVEQLTERRSPRTPFEFLDKRGHLAVESTSVGLNPQQNMQAGTITVRYLPDALYQPGLSWDSEDAPNDFALTTQGTFYLPETAQNVRLRNGETGDSIPLEQLTHRVDEDGADQRHEIGTDDGALAPYTGDFLVSGDKVDSTSGGDSRYSEGSYGLQTMALQPGDGLSHTFSVPDGEYEIIVRAYDVDNSDSFDINGTTVGEDTAANDEYTIHSATDVATSSSLKVTINNVVNTPVHVDYVLVRSVEKPQVVFDYPTGGHVETSALGYWPFDEGEGSTIYDYSTYANDGSINGPDWTTDSKTGEQALEFVASENDTVNLGRPDHLKFDGVRELTFTAWIKPTGNSSQTTVLGTYDGGPAGYIFREVKNRIDLFFDGTYHRSARDISDNEWNFIAATLDPAANTITYYHNGTEIDEVGYGTDDMQSGGSDVYIGVEGAGANTYADGVIDDPRVYPFVASSEQISYLYENPGAYLDPHDAYALNEASSVAVFDSHGSTAEADWERVYDERHDFEGTLVVQNGTVRVYDHPGRDQLEYWAYSEHEGGWHRIGVNRHYDGNTYHSSIDGFTLREIAPDRVVVDLHEEHPEDITPTTLTIREGTPYLELRRDYSDDPYVYYSFYQMPIEWGVTGKDQIYSDAPDDNNRPAFAGRNSTGALRPFGAAYQDSGIVAMWSDRDDAVIGYQVRQIGFCGNADAIAGEASLYIGYLPRERVGAYHGYGYQEFTSGAVSTNHWEMPLGTSGALNEHTGDTGGFTVDTTNEILEHSNDTFENIYLNALQLGASEGDTHYRWSVQASDTTDIERFEGRFASQDTIPKNHEYTAFFGFDLNTIKLRHWDSSGNPTVIAADDSFALNYGTLYHAEIEFYPDTGDIDLYVWADGNGKPSSPSISATDSSLSSGLIGHGVYGSVDLHAWEANAEEVTTDTGNAAIAPSDGINRYSDNSPSVRYQPVAGDDIPLGRYIAAYRLKQTNPPAGTTADTSNLSDGSSLGLDGYGKFKQPDNNERNDYYTYVTRPVEIGADDEDDVLRFGVYNTENDVNHNVVDDIFLVPISGLIAGDRPGPQDLAHQSFARDDSDRELFHRRTL